MRTKAPIVHPTTRSKGFGNAPTPSHCPHADGDDRFIIVKRGVGTLAIVSGLAAFLTLAAVVAPASAQPSRERLGFAVHDAAGRIIGLGRYHLQVQMWHHYDVAGEAIDTGSTGGNILIRNRATGLRLYCWFVGDAPTDFDGTRRASGAAERTGPGSLGACSQGRETVRSRIRLSATIESAGDLFRSSKVDEETGCALRQRIRGETLITGTLRLMIRSLDIDQTIDLVGSTAALPEGSVWQEVQRCP
jgi:hypothetical protein